MTRFLLATDTVHTTAAACDYLADRLGEGDAVIVLAVAEPGAPSRDGADALNVATVRLDPLASVETASAEGAPAETILSVATERDVDEVVVGGAPGTGTDLGSTARAVVARADRAVVVVPVPRLD